MHVVAEQDACAVLRVLVILSVLVLLYKCVLGLQSVRLTCNVYAGITLIELATGFFPYPKWNSVFEQLQQVVHGDPPRLDPRSNGAGFTVEFINFVNTCLIKEESQRPKYTKLLEHPFIKRSDGENVDVAQYVSGVMERWDQEAMDQSA